MAVFNELNVHDNIDYFCGLYISDAAKRKQLVQEAIAFVGLEDYTKQYPPKLSGGLLRRLNIACGIAHKPDLIILDEPTVAVDPQSRNKILEGIVELNKQGATIIYTSHYMEEVEQICTHVIIMDKGRNLAEGTTEQLKGMITAGETVKVEILDLPTDALKEMKLLPNVKSANYEDKMLTIKYKSGQHNLSNLLKYMDQQQITYGRIITELPTLNDVFLEITGKDIRE